MKHSVTRETYIGLQVNGNAYLVAGFPRYLAMQPAELDKTIRELQQWRSKTYSRFIRHHTVFWFSGSSVVLAAMTIANLSRQPSITIATLAWLVVVYLPSFLVMGKQREPLFNALALLKEEIKKAMAAKAITGK